MSTPSVAWELTSGRKSCEAERSVGVSEAKGSGLKRISEAINYIKQGDLTSLKPAYRRMFKKIIVHPLGDKKVKLQFIFNDMTTPPSGGVVANCTAAGWV